MSRSTKDNPINPRSPGRGKLKLYGREPRALILIELKPHRRSRVGARKMIKARHRYQRRKDRQAINHSNYL